MDHEPNTSAMQTTKLNRRWLVKMSIFLIALTGLGIWGLIDALVVYPNRGRASAEFLQFRYLEQAERSGQLLRTTVEDPAAELKRLRAAGDQLNDVERARRQWLHALSMISSLPRIAEQNRAESAKPIGQRGDTPTMFSDPRGRLDTLTQKWSTQTAPKPLSGLDIPSQWVFVAVGFGGAAYLTFFLLRCCRVKFRYAPAERRLTLPSGKSFTPADMKEIDKRLWHKYFLFVTLNDGSPEIKLDLLRYSPLETWILEMWEHSPNYVPEETDDDAEQEPAASESTPDATGQNAD